MSAAELSRLSLPPARFAVILLAFSIPLSVALDNMLLAALLLFGILGAGGMAFSRIRKNPVARSAWLLFGMLALATLYGATPWREALGTLGKYADLAFVPLFMVAASRADVGRRAMYAFMLSVAITLGASYLLGMQLIGIQGWMWFGAGPENPAVFHSSITQNLLTGYAVFLALLHVREARTFARRLVFGVLALAGGVNVLFMGLGRTGYLVLFILLMWFAWSTLDSRLRAAGKKLGWKLVAAFMLLAALSGFAAYQASPRLHERVDQVGQEYRAWHPNVADEASNGTSTGERLEFYYNTLQVIRAHPLFGAGTGGFPAAYAKQVAGTGITATHNPHNEYLLLTVQAGLPALALMLYWLYVQWRAAPRLGDMLQRDAARGLVLTIAISCMVNSSLLDHTEGLFFAFMSALLFANLDKEPGHA